MSTPSTLVDSYTQRMESLGIPLKKYIHHVFKQWGGPTAGFGFICKNPADLLLDLASNSNFARETTLGQRFQSGGSWRQVNQPDSLHILYFKNKWVDELKTRTDYFQIHIDSASVAAGKDPGARACIYDYGRLMDHVFTDLLRTRVITPSSERGLVIGLRF
jgi:hypothetical protein